MSKVNIAVSKQAFFTKIKGNVITKDYDKKKLDYDQIAEYIKKGHSITNIFDNNGEFHRAKRYFVSADFFALDFDNKKEEISKGSYTYFPLDELLHEETVRSAFINKRAFLFYTTQTHSEKVNKFRVLFHLPSRVQSVNAYETITKAFHDYFPEADKTCIEAARFFYGSGISGSVKVLGNRLTQEVVDFVKKIGPDKVKSISNSEILNPVSNKYSNIKSIAESRIENAIITLKRATKGSRNNTLNSVCYIISSIIYEMHQNGLNPDINDIKCRIETTALGLGLQPKEIRRTLESGWNAGTNAKLKYQHNENDRIKRTHANRPIIGNFQVNKYVLDHMPNTRLVNDGMKLNAVKTQIGFFHTFKINFQNEITEQIIDIFLQQIESMDFLLCYFSLWQYAHKIGSTSFERVNLNDIISYNSIKPLNPKEKYKIRVRFIDVIVTLGLVSIIRERSNKVVDQISDYEVTHLINALKVETIKQKTFISCDLPTKQGDIGAYIPERIFEISRQDAGTFYLAITIMKEINRICKSKKVKSGKYESPLFERKPIYWTRKRLITICRIKFTDESNKTQANKSIEHKFQKLKELGIIKSHSDIPLNDDDKIVIIVCNPKKSPLELENFSF